MTIVHDSLAGVSSWLWPMMIHHLWQAAWFSGAAWLLCLVAKRASAKTRYAIWLLASLKCAVPAFFLVSMASSLNVRIAWPVNASSLSSAHAIAEFPFTSHNVQLAVDAGNKSPSTLKPRENHTELYCGFTLAWGAGAVCCLVIFLMRYRTLKMALRQGRLLNSGRAVDALRQMKDLLMERRSVSLLVSSAFSEPGVSGIWRPTLVLPQGMVEALTDQELEAVMLHELVHVQRRDNLVSLFQSWLCGVFWFFPVVWLIDRQLLVERELACDEQVLASTLDSQNYLSSLMKVFRLSLGGKMAGVSLATGSNLKRRIIHMRSQGSRKDSVICHRLMISGFVLALIASVTSAALVNQKVLVAQQRVATSTRVDELPPAALKGLATGVSGGVVGGIENGIVGGITRGVKGEAPKGSGRSTKQSQSPLGLAMNQTPSNPARQAGSAQLSGTVSDASRARVPDATIVISDRESGTKEITTSSAAGEFEFPALPLGRYSIEVRTPGFRLFQQSLELHANEPRKLDVVLEVGEVNQTVNVVAKAPPAAPPDTGSGTPRRIRVGGNVQATKLVHQVNPVYPERARAQGIQGTVLLEAIILKDGALGAMRVLNKLADPDLVEAAIEAVRNWRYEPTLLNGQPIEVVTTITVNFRLSSS